METVRSSKEGRQEAHLGRASRKTMEMRNEMELGSS